MQKIISILLIVTLIFFTINPLPPVFAETPFVGTIGGSVADNSGKGTITVSGAPNGAVLTLYRDNNSSYGSTATVVNQTAIFQNVEAGNYYAKAATITGIETTVSAPSQTVQVKPLAVVITTANDNSTTIVVNNGIPGATFTLYKDADGTAPFNPRTATADAIGSGKFELVPPGKNYRVKQTVNGVDSDPSVEDITIRPSAVKVVPSADAGPSNNQGTLTVLESKSGNIIRLYYGSLNNLIDSKTADSQGGYTFTGLKAGKYYVTQQENGAESSYTEVSIDDAQVPVITLIGQSEVRIVIGENYSDLGATATDNIDDSITLTSKIVVNNPINASSQPGIYSITYNVTDSSGNKAIEVTRKVIIVPKKVALTPVHTNDATDPTPKDGPEGQIKVDHVYPGAILYLYQDPNGELIRTITDASSPGYTINNVPVGKDYYIIQEFHNANGTVVESEPSDRKEIQDKTPPALTLNGANPINLVMGDRYIEYGATATDNVDKPEELNSQIEITGTVNINVPGIYTITYKVKDKAGNVAEPITRTVNVSPSAVIAIGSTADYGEVGVKNALPGATLQLYTSDGKKVPGQQYTYTLKTNETTYVFKDVGPGSYYVTQLAGTFESVPSNVVDVVDIDRPYITLIGPENLTFTWKTSEDPYYSSSNIFADPGATAYDYIEEDLTSDITIKTKPNIGVGAVTDLQIPAPGSYKITYSVAAARGTTADDKHRTVIVAPPKLGNLYSEAGKSTIDIRGGTFNHATTIVNLYNTYDQLIESKLVDNSLSTAQFADVPAGLGYYVTQTVNSIESAPSEPVDVTLFTGAPEYASLNSFEFTSLGASGVIDHETALIRVTVPMNTDVTKLKASFTGTGLLTVGGIQQISGQTVQNFSKLIIYTVWSNNGSEKKDYVIIVTKSAFTISTGTDTIKKNETFSTNEKIITLSPAEKRVATEKGISFIATDRAVHVSAANVKEASRAALTVSTVSFANQSTDPAWKKTITNAMKLNWDGSTTSFLQPIEIEMPNPDKKVFAKLVLENGKLYAIIQQSEQVGNNIVGLVTKPGTYALITNITKPLINPSTQNDETTYRLYTSETGAQIYYTINSSDIAFDRSARKSSLSSYSMDGAPSDLSAWTLYTAGERISAPNGELYAFTMKDQMISPLNTIETKAGIAWNDDVPMYPTHKVLSVTFNSKVDKKALYSNSIYVKDDATGNTVATTLSLSTDGKTITVTPITAYTPNKQYTLYIERQIKGNTENNEFLKQPLTQTFTVK